MPPRSVCGVTAGYSRLGAGAVPASSWWGGWAWAMLGEDGSGAGRGELWGGQWPPQSSL